MAWIPLVWFQQVHQPYVTPGNRAAAVIAGFNIIIFSTIAVLARHESRSKMWKEHLTGEPSALSDGGGETDKVTVNAIAVLSKDKVQAAELELR
jgi:ACS family pantothenate transporter-like MFS transporter